MLGNSNGNSAALLVGLVTFAGTYAVLLLRRVFAVPTELKHLPCVPVWPLLRSYASGETEELRIKRLFLPCAEKHGAGLVLVWTFGTWMVHCVDYKLGKALMENRLFTKQPPPEHMLFWRFTGRANIFFIEGDKWRTQGRAVRTALARAAPVRHFAALADVLFAQLGAGGRVCWSDYAHRYSLDAIGATVLGHDFAALADPRSPFVEHYREVMHSIANPLYMFLPFLETWLPRKRVIAELDGLVEEFRKLLQVKKNTPGDDLISYMLEEPDMTDQEHRDNVIVLFMAGHDTTAGALSTLVYCFAKYPEIQRKAREEVLTFLGTDAPTQESLLRLPYLQACIRESMRYNNPSTTNIPRVSTEPIRAGGLLIPPGTPVMLNMYGIMHNAAEWPDADTFEPTRFLRDGVGGAEDVPVGWAPFGLGPRQCPARSFSMYEQRTLMAMLLREYEWVLPADSSHVDGIRNAFSAFALNLPEDLDIIFTRRT
ncbi:cytochrome P450 [Phellopilus nigrolimitatus]|nr:cytochrome P450 [Phellopilus nigrolimitatus]